MNHGCYKNPVIAMEIRSEWRVAFVSPKAKHARSNLLLKVEIASPLAVLRLAMTEKPLQQRPA